LADPEDCGRYHEHDNKEDSSGVCATVAPMMARMFGHSWLLVISRVTDPFEISKDYGINRLKVLWLNAKKPQFRSKHIPKHHFYA
jgi:hypothetical protein